MAQLGPYNDTVAARTRTAHQIFHTPDLLAKFDALGGLSEDLVEIEKQRDAAEAANLGQQQAHAAGGAATQGILVSFADVQREYVVVMAVAHAARGDLARAGAKKATQA